MTVQPVLRGGMNTSEINGIKGDNKTDFYLGASLALNLSRFYTLQPEITFSNQGGENIYKLEKVYNSATGKYDYIGTYKNFDLQYLSIGVANKFYVTPRRDFHLLVAPSLDILLDDGFDNSRISSDGYYYDNYNDNDITGFDLAFAFGAGYEFPFGLGVEARYKVGIIDILDFFSDGNSKNNVVQLGLNYKFKFRK